MSIDEMVDHMEKIGHKNTTILKYMIAKKIPMEEFQANLMFFKRGYGKSWMSYILVYADMLNSNKDIFDIRPKYDMDANEPQRKRTWLVQFDRFMEKYGDEFVKDKKNSTQECRRYIRL